MIVYGAGGVGISAIQGARIAGASEIVAVDMNPNKLEEAKAFGATHSCTPDEVDSLKNSITGGMGFDYALECIGKAATMRASRCMAADPARSTWASGSSSTKRLGMLLCHCAYRRRLAA